MSPRTAQYLRDTVGLDAVHLSDLSSGSPTDEEVVTLARREGRVIITFDRDFGEIYFLNQRGALGVIVLEIRNQTVEAVNTTLARFFSGSALEVPLESSLVVIEETRVRIA